MKTLAISSAMKTAIPIQEQDPYDYIACPGEVEGNKFRNARDRTAGPLFHNQDATFSDGMVAGSD